MKLLGQKFSIPFLAVLTLLLSTSALSAQNENPSRHPVQKPFSAPLPPETFTYPDAEPHVLPSWVEFGRGEMAVQEKHYGQAVNDFRKAIERKGIYPEAEWKLAEVAGINGDPLVEAQLLRHALGEAGLLAVPDDKWAILYTLAKVEKQLPSPGLEKKSLAMDTYREILSQDPDYEALEAGTGLGGYDAAFFTKPGRFVYQSTGKESFTSQLTGLNRVLYLYHHPVDFSLKAHQELAKLYLENHAWDQAEVHALYALTAIFSTVIDAVQAQQPDYVFHSLNDFFRNRNSPVFLGVDPRLQSHRGPGSANPGWMSRWQDIWDFLKKSKTDETLATLDFALRGIEKRDRLFTAPPDNRRTAQQAQEEVLGWLHLIFPNSPWNAILRHEAQRTWIN